MLACSTWNQGERRTPFQSHLRIRKAVQGPCTSATHPGDDELPGMLVVGVNPLPQQRDEAHQVKAAALGHNVLSRQRAERKRMPPSPAQSSPSLQPIRDPSRGKPAARASGSRIGPLWGAPVVSLFPQTGCLARRVFQFKLKGCCLTVSPIRLCKILQQLCCFPLLFI